MRVTGFSGILAGIAAATLLALPALPLHAASGGGHGADPAPGPVIASPLKAIPLLDVPADELSDSVRPAEPPPPDFTAAQFIDSAGCVFVRVKEGWRARIARDGSTICGYPPTFSARRTGPDSVSPLFPEPEEPRAQRIERVLTGTILPALQTGELSPDTRTQGSKLAAPQAATTPPNPAPVAAREPAPAKVMAEADPLGFAAAVAGAPALRAGMTAGSGSSRLCALLGSAPAGADGVRGSMALGICGPPDPRALAPGAVSRVASADPSDVAYFPEAARQTTPMESRPATVRRAPSASKKVKDARPKSEVKRQTALESSRGTGEIVIPPGAKYVQIGAFRDPRNAERTARRLAAMGFPVVRSKGASGLALQLVMVGPLDGREAMVRAIDRVRRAGYRDAYPRR